MIFIIVLADRSIIVRIRPRHSQDAHEHLRKSVLAQHPRNVRYSLVPQDTDRSGSIGFAGMPRSSPRFLHAILTPTNSTEFSGLWKYIADWQGVFRHFDRDQSGSIEGSELAEALSSFGYNLSPTLLMLVEQKYGQFADSEGMGCEMLMFFTASAPISGFGPPPGITFDRFVRACVVIKTLTEAFQRYAGRVAAVMHDG